MSVRDTWKARIKAALTEEPVSTADLATATAVPKRDALSILQQLSGNRLAARRSNPAGSHRGHMWVRGPGR